MEQQFERTSLLYGKENIDKLKNKHVAIFGVGGVGGYVVESLIRSGIGHISIFDNDVVSITNINRQIIALYSTIGQYKVDVLKKRILDINPNCEVHAYKMFVDENNINDIDFSQFDYVVDAIDTVKSKIAIIKKCHDENIKILSSMGAGNKNNPMGFAMMYNQNLLFEKGIKKQCINTIRMTALAIYAKNACYIFQRNAKVLAVILFPLGWALSIRRKLQFNKLK